MENACDTKRQKLNIAADNDDEERNPAFLHAEALGFLNASIARNGFHFMRRTIEAPRYAAEEEEGVASSTPEVAPTCQDRIMPATIKNNETDLTSSFPLTYSAFFMERSMEQLKEKRVRKQIQKNRMIIEQAQQENVRLELEEARLAVMMTTQSEATTTPLPPFQTLSSLEDTNYSLPSLVHAIASSNSGAASENFLNLRVSTALMMGATAEASLLLACISQPSHPYMQSLTNLLSSEPQEQKPGTILRAPRVGDNSMEILAYKAPMSLITGTECYFKIVAPSTAIGSSPEECPICMCDLSDSQDLIVSLVKCGHVYHHECIQQALKRSSSKCPTCRSNIIEPQGLSPSGTMTVTYSKCQSCAGNEGVGSYVIDYKIGNGIQTEFHENPGVPFRGAQRRAFVPASKDGSYLLKRLKYAWMHGLTFTVGTSLTTSIPNIVTWSSIHHKTARHGGTHMHGFPDPSYFHNCNEELDNLEVPREL